MKDLSRAYIFQWPRGITETTRLNSSHLCWSQSVCVSEEKWTQASTLLTCQVSHVRSPERNLEIQKISHFFLVTSGELVHWKDAIGDVSGSRTGLQMCMLWETMFFESTSLPKGCLGSCVRIGSPSLYVHGWVIKKEAETERWTHFYSLTPSFRVSKAILLIIQDLNLPSSTVSPLGFVGVTQVLQDPCWAMGQKTNPSESMYIVPLSWHSVMRSFLDHITKMQNLHYLEAQTDQWQHEKQEEILFWRPCEKCCQRNCSLKGY